jgi:hypothetical protein
MSRKLFSLRTIQIIRSIRAGASEQELRKSHGVAVSSATDLANMYKSVPNEALARMERLLSENDKLRRILAHIA